jgi:hypothetical protein
LVTREEEVMNCDPILEINEVKIFHRKSSDSPRPAQKKTKQRNLT